MYSHCSFLKSNPAGPTYLIKLLWGVWWQHLGEKKVVKRSWAWDGDHSQKFSETVLASEAVTSLLIPRGAQGIVEGQENKEKRWKAREDLGIPREGRGGDAERLKLTLGILKRTRLTPQPKRWDWNGPAGLGKDQIVRGAGRVPLEHCSPFWLQPVLEVQVSWHIWALDSLEKGNASLGLELGRDVREGAVSPGHAYPQKGSGRNLPSFLPPQDSPLHL